MVVFERDPVGFDAQRVHQLPDRRPRAQLLQGARLSIQDKGKRHTPIAYQRPKVKRRNSINRSGF